MEKIRIGIIGFGNRGRLYGSFIRDNLDKVELVAICENRIDEMKDAVNDMHPLFKFKTDDELFDANLDLDLLLICSMDQYHFDECKRGLLAGYNILLEKPISSSFKEVEELNAIATSRGLKVLVTYVLRYTLFYRKMKDIIDSGEIGQVVNINTTENVSYWHQAHSYCRGNWRNSKETGPMILTKCSHDMDLAYWLMGKSPVRVSSFGDLTYLKKENAPENAAEYCTDCPCKDSCAFNCYKFYLNNRGWLAQYTSDLSDEGIQKYLDHSRFSKCVFKCDNDVVDHQIVNIEFEDGTTASHTMNAYSCKCYRDIKVFGTKGFISGSLEDEKFEVYHFLDDKSYIVDITKFTDDFVGHGGGDRIMFNELLDYLRTNNKTKSLTSIQESVISHEMAFAAETSRLHHGEVVELKYGDK